MTAGNAADAQTHKLTVVTGAQSAVAIEAALLALEHPALLAVSRFEDGPVDWRIEAYFADAGPWAGVDAILASAAHRSPLVIEPVVPTNWVAHVEAMLSPVEAGRFLIYGPHDRDKAAAHPLAIEIEAGEAFGTAHHGSTEGCLRVISHVVPGLAPKDVLDLGTGTGVLAIAVAKLAPDARILASDIDVRSVEIASENSIKNGVGSSIEAFVATGLEHPRLSRERSFDLVIANILAWPLVDLAPGIARAIKPDGRIILSGLLDKQAAEVLHAYAGAGCTEINRVTRGEWVTLLLAPGGAH